MKMSVHNCTSSIVVFFTIYVIVKIYWFNIRFTTLSTKSWQSSFKCYIHVQYTSPWACSELL